MTKIYKPHAGQNITDAISGAIKLAQESNDDVTFYFNGDKLTALPSDDTESILRGWEGARAQRQAEYQASDEYKQHQEERKNEIAQKQSAMDELMVDLARLNFDDLTDILAWLKSYAPLADDIGVNYYQNAVLNQFTLAGFKANAHLITKDHSPNFGDKNVFGEYIVGQAINYLESGMPPHPIIINFISQWSK